MPLRSWFGAKQKQDVYASDAEVSVTGEKRRVLDEARLALRLGFFEHLQGLLLNQSWAQVEAASLNLLGVASELQGQWNAARRYYTAAIRCNRSYPPTWQNLRRIYELETFGQSDVPVALGDERPALGKLLEATGAQVVL